MEMRRIQPTTYPGAAVRAMEIVGVPLLGSLVARALWDHLSWWDAGLNVLIWLAVSALLTLAFSGGIEPRADRDEEREER
jgi:hypothetical protein